MKLQKNNLLKITYTVSCLCMFLLLYFSMVRDSVIDLSFVKYISIVLFLVLIAITSEVRIYDLWSFLGLLLYLFFTTFFTLMNLSDFDDLVVLFGYYVLVLLFVFSGSREEFLSKSLIVSLFIFGVFFVSVAYISLMNQGSFSASKGQYQGFLVNPNAFAGLMGLILIFFVFFKTVGKLSILRYFIILSCVVFLLMSFSRGAILSIALTFVLFKLSKFNFSSLIYIALFFILSFILFSGYIDYSSISERSLLEETGRGEIFYNYLKKFDETYFIWGTGISLASGRIKSELSYFDIALFSGVGALGFFLFLFRVIYLSIKNIYKISEWKVMMFFYIAIISIFEGYAANVASIPSVLLYLLAVLIFAEIKKNKRIVHV